MEPKERIEDDLMPQKNKDGRDEMNLAEFPLCALAHRLRPEQKTLHFEDRMPDPSRRGEHITRRLTITGSDAFGLPTELDDQVLLALIQITRHHEFVDRKVPFTRHELIRLLGWRDDSKNYHRIEESLNRWTGVTLYYNKAWWNKAKKSWMDEKFHILDNVWLCHRDEPPPDTGLDESSPRMSAFVWNEVIFRSFSAGNLKSIDFEFYKSLRSAVAKRLYRFLDKRFYHRKRWEFDLRELCFEHIGLSRNYDTTNLKRKLLPAIRELEDRGFLQRIPLAEQFRKLRPRSYRIRFQREEPTPTWTLPAFNKDDSALAQILVERGVTKEAATRAVQNFPEERIQRQVEIFDWLLKRKDPKVSKNPPGFLISSITAEYQTPKDFLLPCKTRPERRVVRCSAETSSPSARDTTREKAIEAFWQNLSEPDRQRFESEALAEAKGIHVRFLEGRGALALATKQCLLNAYALKMLKKA